MFIVTDKMCDKYKEQQQYFSTDFGERKKNYIYE